MSRADVIAVARQARHEAQRRKINNGPNVGTDVLYWFADLLDEALAAAEPAAEHARAGALTEAEKSADWLDRHDARDIGALIDAIYDPVERLHFSSATVGEISDRASEAHHALARLRAALAGDAEHERSGT